MFPNFDFKVLDSYVSKGRNLIAYHNFKFIGELTFTTTYICNFEITNILLIATVGLRGTGSKLIQKLKKITKGKFFVAWVENNKRVLNFFNKHQFRKNNTLGFSLQPEITVHSNAIFHYCGINAETIITLMNRKRMDLKIILFQ
jgi:predicted acetyltransferase